MKKILIGILLPVLFVILQLNFAQAQTPSTGVAIANPPTNCYTWTVNMGIGSRGPDVAALQTFLISRGFDISAVSTNQVQKGYFGNSTAQAVSAFQRSVGIQATGYVGPLTRAALRDICSGSVIVGKQVIAELIKTDRSITDSETDPIGVIRYTVKVTNTTDEDVYIGTSSDSFSLSFSNGVEYNGSTFISESDPGHFIHTIESGTSQIFDIAVSVRNVGTSVISVNLTGINYSTNQNLSPRITIPIKSGLVYLVLRPSWNPRISVISPRTGQTLTTGAAYEITWVDPGVKNKAARYILSLSSNNGKEAIGGYLSASEYCDKATCTYKWIPVTAASNAQISVYDDVNGSSAFAGYSGFFTVASKTVPTISYIQAPAADKNILYPGQRATLYGSNLGNAVSVNILGKAYDTNVEAYSKSNSSLSFLVPSDLTPGLTYDVKLYVKGEVNQTNSIRVTVANVAATPSIKVVYPNGGERYMSGQTNISIKYSSVGITGSHITASLYSPTLGNVRSVSGTAAASGLLYIPLSSGAADAAGQYKIMICSDYATGSKDLCDSSDSYFELIGPSLNPTITVTSPGSGDKWQAGESYRINWTSEDIMAANAVVAYLKGNTTATYVKIGSGSNSGSMPVKIPLDIPAEEYTLQLISNVSGKIITGTQDVFVVKPVQQITSVTIPQTVSPQSVTVQSGNTVRFTFSVPANIVSARYIISCPEGVTIFDENKIRVCNSSQTLSNTSGSQAKTFQIFNSTNAAVSASLAYYVSYNGADEHNTTASIGIEPIPTYQEYGKGDLGASIWDILKSMTARW